MKTNKVNPNRMTIKKLTDSGEWKVCVYIDNKLCEASSAYCGDKQEAEETKAQMEKHFRFEDPKVEIGLTEKQYSTLKTIQNRNNFYPSAMGMILTDCSRVSREDYLTIINEKVFYKFLDTQAKYAYREERYEEHNDLVNIRTLLFKKFTISAKGSTTIGGDKVEFNVQYNPVKDYGSFEFYSLDDDMDVIYYAEGGLWFKGKELTDYDGCYELPKYIQKQLNKWNLDTSYLD